MSTGVGNYMRKCFLLIFIIFLASCSLSDTPDILKPMPWLFKQVPENAPNKYKEGWKHGCESGLASMTNSYFKSFYKFRQNKKLITNKSYYKAWKDTYDFCRHYAYGTIRQADNRYRLPHQQPRFLATFMGTRNILDYGLLQMWGPGGNNLVPLKNFGHLGGVVNNSEVGAGSSMDFSDGYAFSGNGVNNAMNWDFRGR